MQPKNTSKNDNSTSKERKITRPTKRKKSSSKRTTASSEEYTDQRTEEPKSGTNAGVEMIDERQAGVNHHTEQLKAVPGIIDMGSVNENGTLEVVMPGTRQKTGNDPRVVPKGTAKKRQHGRQQSSQ